LQPIVLGLGEGGIAKAPESVIVGWLRLVAAHSVAAAAPSIEPLLALPHPSGVRCAALRALAAVGTPRLREHVQVALADRDGELRAIALEALSKIAPADARPLAERVLLDGELRERRTACRLLGALADPAATPALGAQLDKLLAGLFPVELSFDLVSAARARKDPGLDAKLAALERSRALDPTLAPWIETLFGGQQEAGKGVFREKSETSCLRCHKTEWDEGGDVGPDLRGIGKRLSRLQILESILQPNRHVDPGYRNTLFALQDERVVEARILLEDELKFRVLDANAKTFDLPKSEVESHRDGLSAMPEGLEKFLTPREMRDLIEYLCSI
jgi:quinoprotein glucose dehydrogenase